jgi:hypothetical protein
LHRIKARKHPPPKDKILRRFAKLVLTVVAITRKKVRKAISISEGNCISTSFITITSHGSMQTSPTDSFPLNENEGILRELRALDIKCPSIGLIKLRLLSNTMAKKIQAK